MIFRLVRQTIWLTTGYISSLLLFRIQTKPRRKSLNYHWEWFGMLCNCLPMLLSQWISHPFKLVFHFRFKKNLFAVCSIVAIYLLFYVISSSCTFCTLSTFVFHRYIAFDFVIVWDEVRCNKIDSVHNTYKAHVCSLQLNSFAFALFIQ